MAKPTNPNINFPQAFAIDGQKTDFLEEKIQDGFDPIDPDVLAGDNLNKFIDDTYKGLHYAMDGVNDLYKGAVLYSSTETYNSTSIVFSISEDGIALYHSLTDNNTGNPLTDETKWQKVDLGGGSSSGTGYQLFDIIAKDHILTEDESLGLALLGTYVNKSVYPDFYNTCVSEKTAGTPTQTQLGDNTITTYNNANGHIFYDIADKATVDAFYEALGIAWFYGVDTTNERIFLPRGKNYISVTNPESLPVVGNGTAIGFSNNYGGVISAGNAGNGIPSPILGLSTDAYGVSVNSIINRSDDVSNVNRAIGLSTDASKSGIIAQTQDLFSNNKEAYLYMVVGNTQVEQAIINVTEVTTTENDTLPLFTPKYFDFTPNHVSWLKAGQQANSGGIYTTAYNALVSELTLPTYGLKVIEVDNMQSDVDYSEYWKVDQDAQTFTTPTRISNAALTGRVKGNGMTLGFTDGTQNAGLRNAVAGGSANSYMALDTNYYGQDIGYSGAMGGNLTGTTAYGVTDDPIKSGLISEEATSQLYFKVANAVQNLQLLDAGEITEALADKIGTTECKAYVTETYSNGASWYRVYSDGWCEQGGSYNQTGSTTINYPKTYTDTNYTLNVTLAFNGESSVTSHVRADNKSTTGFTTVGGNINGIWWITAGYIS